MKEIAFAGVDVSKKTIDIAIKLTGKERLAHKQFANNIEGFDQMLGWINQQSPETKRVFCMEHTGVYVLPLACYLSEKKIDFCLENPLHIKASMGIRRGKNDKADAKMIARYACLHAQELKISALPAKSLMKLKALLVR